MNSKRHARLRQHQLYRKVEKYVRRRVVETMNKAIMSAMMWGSGLESR